MRVGSYPERGTDFTRYRTYDWAPAGQFSTGDPRLDNNPFFQERLRAAVEKELAARGFEKRTSETSDLLIHYHASIRERIDVSGLDREYGYEAVGPTLNFGRETGLVLSPQVDLGQMFVVSAIILLVAVAGTVQPAFKASRMEPVEALRHG
jgi:hypothetical protein